MPRPACASASRVTRERRGLVDDTHRYDQDVSVMAWSGVRIGRFVARRGWGVNGSNHSTTYGKNPECPLCPVGCGAAFPPLSRAARIDSPTQTPLQDTFPPQTASPSVLPRCGRALSLCASRERTAGAPSGQTCPHLASTPHRPPATGAGVRPRLHRRTVRTPTPRCSRFARTRIPAAARPMRWHGSCGDRRGARAPRLWARSYPSHVTRSVWPNPWE